MKVLNKNYRCVTSYMKTIMNIFSIAKEMNESKNYFPIWTTCLGFEALIFYFTDFSV